MFNFFSTHNQGSSLLLRLSILILVVPLLLAGCGSSQDYVFTSAQQNVNPAPIQGKDGALEFNFVRAQAALPVPSRTTDLRFEFFDGRNGTGNTSLTTQLRAFAPNIVVRPVPITTRSVVVTALTSQGVPLFEAVVEVNITPDQTEVVDFASATSRAIVATTLALSPESVTVGIGGTAQFTTRATYSNGDTIANPVEVQFSSSAPATIRPSGLAVAGDESGIAVITASVDGAVATAQLRVIAPEVSGLVSLTPDPIELSIGSVDNTTAVTVVGTLDTAEGPTSRPLTNDDGLTFLAADPAVATVDIDGRVSAVAVGNTTLTASVGNLTRTVDVRVSNPQGNDLPVVQLEPSLSGEFFLNTTTTTRIFPNAIVTDDQARLQGGYLSVSYVEGNSTATVTAPTTPEIGLVEPTSKGFVVTLNREATPSAIAAFLRGVTATTSKACDAQFYVTLDDSASPPARGSDVRSATIVSPQTQILQVPDQYPTIRSAVDAANGLDTLILVSSGDYSSEDISILTPSVRLHGHYAGVAAAGSGGPSPSRSPDRETVVGRIFVLVPNAGIDGLDIRSSIQNAVYLGGRPNNFTLQNSIIRYAVKGSVSGLNLYLFRQPPSDGFRIVGNHFENCLSAVEAGDEVLGTVFVYGNSFLNNNFALTVRSSSADIVLAGNLFENRIVLENQRYEFLNMISDGPTRTNFNDNDLLGVGSVRLFGEGGPVLDASRNYWPGGPNTEVGGSEFEDPVILTEPTSAKPTTRFPVATP